MSEPNNPTLALPVPCPLEPGAECYCPGICLRENRCAITRGRIGEPYCITGTVRPRRSVGEIAVIAILAGVLAAGLAPALIALYRYITGG